MTSGLVSVFLASFVGPYLFPAAGELAIVAAIGLGLDPLLVFSLGLAGSIASDQLGYGIGRAGGSPIVERMVLPERRAVLEDRVHRHAVVALVPGRMLPGARTWVAILAGIARLPWARFSALNAIGCLIWAAAFVAAVGEVDGGEALEGAVAGVLEQDDELLVAQVVFEAGAVGVVVVVGEECVGVVEPGAKLGDRDGARAQSTDAGVRASAAQRTYPAVASSSPISS